MSTHHASARMPRTDPVVFARTALLFCTMLSAASSLVAQNPGTPAGKGAAPSHRVMIPPAETRVKGAAAQSTAASRAARVQAPLTALPAFAVQDTSGKPLSSTNLQPTRRHEHWVLVLTADSCAGCDRVLAAFGASSTSQLHESGRLTVVVRARQARDASAALDHVRSVSTNLSNAVLAADASGSAATALHVNTMPTVLLMEGSSIHTTLHGTMGDPARLAGLAAAWVTHEPAATASGAPASTETDAEPAAPTPAPSKAVSAPMEKP